MPFYHFILFYFTLYFIFKILSQESLVGLTSFRQLIKPKSFTGIYRHRYIDIDIFLSFPLYIQIKHVYVLSQTNVLSVQRYNISEPTPKAFHLITSLN